jgi:predicted metal-dependent hydrolase
MTIVINQDETFTEAGDSGELFREISGFSAKRLVEDSAIDWHRLCKKITLQTFVGIHKARLFFGQIRGQTKVVSIMSEYGTTHYRLFSVFNTETAEDLAARLIENNGYLTREELDFVKDNSEKFFDEANLVYQKECAFFSENVFMRNAREYANIGTVLAKEYMAGHKTDFMTKDEAIDLIQNVADEYGLKNVSVVYENDNGTRLGSCKTDTFPILGPVSGICITLSANACFRHVVLHELAHGIDQFRHRQSSHGKLWRDIYSKLLNDYHGGIKGLFDNFDEMSEKED